MSSGGSFIATLDCKPAVPGSNLAISPAYSRLLVVRWAAICDGILLWRSSEGQQRRINTKRASGPPKQLMKKKLHVTFKKTTSVIYV